MNRFLQRLFLWCLPLITAGALLFLTSWAEETAALEQARSLLVMGETEKALQLFAQHRDSLLLRETAQAGSRIARVASGEDPAAIDIPAVDPGYFPVNLLARTAFDQGDFQTSLRLHHLVEQADLPSVDAVAAAALIESEQSSDARPLLPQIEGAPGKLASRVRSFLEAEERAAAWTLGQGVQLLDREGRLIGEWQPEDGLQLAKGVAPELVPQAVTELLAGNGSASVRLSIDLELSRLALSSFGTYRGSLVVLDPATGEVLVAVSDRHTTRRSGGTPAFEQLREPASISKVITTSAALRAGLDPDRAIGKMTCRGHQRFDGQFLYCPSIAGRLRGLDHAMAVSCNVAFADLGVRLGRQKMLDELHHFGFDRTDHPFPFGQVLESHGDRRQLADLSIGLEATAITPLHAALMAAVIANDGVMPSPTLIAGQDGRLGLHPRRAAPQPGRRVIDPDWLPTLRRSMEAVADYGTASSMAPRSFPVAMKTGTASDRRYGFHTNYIGIGPLPDARVAFAIRLTDQPTSRKVRRASRYVTERFLHRLARWHQRRGTSTMTLKHAEIDWRPGFETALLTPPASFRDAAGR